MKRPELLSLIVLGLPLFVYTSVHSLETGYQYTNKHTVNNHQLHKDLKCGYLLGWYTHMRVFKLLLDEPFNRDLKGLVGPISSTTSVVRSQIISLMGLRGIPIGAMWVLYLFTGLVSSFYANSKNPTVDYPKIVETLFYVVDKLQADQAGCRQGNSFDSYDIVLKKLGTSGPGHYKTTILSQHVNKVKAQLQKNNIINNDSLELTLERSTQIHTLFWHNLGMHGRIKNDFQNVYNLQMEWNDSSAVLHTVWVNARYLDWTNTNLFPIKMYYNACFDFFEIILLRLTLKHTTYLRDFPIDSDLFSHYVQEWYNIVVRFSTMLNLSDDLYVYRLLENLRNLISRKQTLANVVSFLVTSLNTLCQPFGCDASNEFIIDNQEFTIPFTSMIGNEIKFPEKPASGVGIEYNSLENAKTFLSHLELAFSAVNYSTIRLLTKYIEELNPTTGV